MNELLIWGSNTGANLPQNINHVKDLLPFNQRLTDKEIVHINKAFENELYDMSVEYTWKRTFNIIKEKVLSFGKEFVLEMLGRTDSDAIDSISEIEVIKLAADLGIINETARLRFLHIVELINHYSSRNIENEEIDRLDALKNIQLCIKYVLGLEEDGFQISFNNFREKLKLENIEHDEALLETLSISPYFYKRTTVRTLLNLIKSTKGAELETVFENMLIIIPIIWDDLSSDDRYPIGFSYSEAVNEGNLKLVKALKAVLLRVRGFDYVPEDLRSRSFIEAAKKLLDVHHGFDNFYREPASAKNLLSMGTSIPKPALGPCISATIACKLGNSYGISNDAQPILNEILGTLSKERWEYYFNSVFRSDEEILYKLISNSQRILDNWINIINNFNISMLNFGDTQIKRLVKASQEGNSATIIEISKKLYKDIRG